MDEVEGHAIVTSWMHNDAHPAEDRRLDDPAITPPMKAVYLSLKRERRGFERAVVKPIPHGVPCK